MSAVPHFVFDTSEVAPEHRFEAWDALLGVTHEVTAQSHGFSARVASTSIDRMIVRTMSASPQAVARSRQRTRSDGLDHIILHLTTSAFDAETESHAVHAPVGSVTVNTLSQPFRRTAAAEHGSAILSLSRDLLTEMLLDPEDFHGTVLTGSFGGLFAAHMSALTRHAHLIAPEQAEGIARASAQLLAAGLAPDRRSSAEAQRAREAAALVRCKRFIERNLSSANLSPDTVCRNVGISRSALYRNFAEYGGVAQYIRARRLHAARAELASSGGSRRVSEVAYSFGFTDAAAFSRSFRQAFGVNPSDLAGMTYAIADTSETDIFREWIRAVTP